MISKRQFENRIKKVMAHNGYEPTWVTVTECNKVKQWTPVDLILREYYNNGGGSAQGFLGITPIDCLHCFDYIKANQQELREEDRYNKVGRNNFGFILWLNYKID